MDLGFEPLFNVEGMIQFPLFFSGNTMMRYLGEDGVGSIHGSVTSGARTPHFGCLFCVVHLPPGVGQEALKAVVEMEAGGDIRSGPPVDTPSSLLKRPRMDDEKDDPVGAPATSEVPTAPTSTKGPRDAGSSLGINGEKDTPARSKRRRKHRGARSPPSAAKEEKNVFVDGQRDQGPSTSLPAKATENAPLHLEALAEELVKLRELAKRTKGLFEWVDGPLVSAMRNGELILLDELSLADDAVLERLNSVLEPGRSITLAEKGGERSVDGITAETVVAATGFR